MGRKASTIAISSFLALATLTHCGYATDGTVGVIGGGGPEKGDNEKSAVFPVRDSDSLQLLAFDEVLRIRRTVRKLTDGGKVGKDGCINYRPHRVGKTTLKADFKCTWKSPAPGTPTMMGWALVGTENISENAAAGEKPIRESSGTLRLVGAWMTNLDKPILSTNLRRKVEIESAAGLSEMSALAEGDVVPFNSELEEGTETSTKLEWYRIEGGGEITLGTGGEPTFGKGAGLSLAYRPAGNSEKPQTFQFVLSATTEVEFKNQPGAPCARPVGKFTWTRSLGATDETVSLTTDETGITDAAGKKVEWPRSCLETGT